MQSIIRTSLHRLMLGLRQLWRERRSSEIHILFLAIVIAVATSTSIGYLSARLKASMQGQAAEFMGADLRLSGAQAATPQQIEAGLNLGLQHAHVVEFSSVVSTEQYLQLSSIKAADAAYPLRGQIISQTTADPAPQSGGYPQPGEVWAEQRLLDALNVHLGDLIEIGRISLKVTRILTQEPDQAADIYSLMPHVLMHLDDLPATDVVQPGSRVRYRDLWAGSPPALEKYQEYLEAHLEPGQRVQGVKESSGQRVGTALQRAEHYLNLASLITLLLSGIAVALAATRFANRRLDACALLRCLGQTSSQSLSLYAVQLGALGLGAGVIGAILGWAFQYFVFYLVRDLVQVELPPTGLGPALLGLSTGFTMLIGFALPPLAALGQVPPARILRQDSLPMPISRWLAQGSALIALLILMWQLRLDTQLIFVVLGGACIIAVVVGAALLWGLKALKNALQQAPLHWRLGLGQLIRHSLSTVGQVLAFGLILLSMALIILLRAELISNWREQLPEQAPNQFAINIQPDEQQAFSQRIDQVTGQTPSLYPVIRGRLTQINGSSAEQRARPDSQGERAIRRELNVTWSQELPLGNQLLSGTWWPSTPNKELSRVSLDAELAESLGIKLQDRLTFDFGSEQREVQVSSLRSVNWDSLQPNFYVIFEPGSLEGLATTYMTSFYLSAQANTALVQLARDFPSVTLIQVDALLAQLQSILAQVSLAVESLLVFVLAAGVILLLAGLLATLDERMRQGAILRALGAQRQLLQRARLTEFAFLGAASGFIAFLGCELITAILYHKLLGMDWQPHPWLLCLPLLGALIISAAGLLGTNRVLRASPLELLREH